MHSNEFESLFAQWAFFTRIIATTNDDSFFHSRHSEFCAIKANRKKENDRPLQQIIFPFHFGLE